MTFDYETEIEWKGDKALSVRGAKLPEIQVLFMSGYPDDAVLRRGLIAANTNFLHKPFTAIAVAKRVRQLLNTRQSSLGGLTN